MPDNPPRYWFPAKRYGYGWGFPCAWQGWALLVGYVVLVFAPLLRGRNGAALSLVMLAAATPVLVFVCYRKGEPPRWRWGRREDANRPPTR